MTDTHDETTPEQHLRRTATLAADDLDALAERMTLDMAYEVRRVSDALREAAAQP